MRRNVKLVNLNARLVMQDKVLLAAPGKRRSRDPKDDPVLATALAALARYLVAGDRDLLVLERPFGIEIVSPAEFLSRTEPKS